MEFLHQWYGEKNCSLPIVQWINRWVQLWWSIRWMASQDRSGVANMDQSYHHRQRSFRRFGGHADRTISGGPEVLMIEKIRSYWVVALPTSMILPINPWMCRSRNESVSRQAMDFVEWLESNHFKLTISLKSFATGFIPRKIFGDYVLETWKVQHDTAGRLQIRIDEAISILDFGTRKRLFLLPAMHCMPIIHTCPWEFSAGRSFSPGQPVQNDPRYYASPWSDKVYSHIVGDEDILLVGSGLTAVDIVLDWSWEVQGKSPCCPGEDGFLCAWFVTSGFPGLGTGN